MGYVLLRALDIITILLFDLYDIVYSLLIYCRALLREVRPLLKKKQLVEGAVSLAWYCCCVTSLVLLVKWFYLFFFTTLTLEYYYIGLWLAQRSKAPPVSALYYTVVVVYGSYTISSICSKEADVSNKSDRSCSGQSLIQITLYKFSQNLD